MSNINSMSSHPRSYHGPSCTKPDFELSGLKLPFITTHSTPAQNTTAALHLTWVHHAIGAVVTTMMLSILLPILSLFLFQFSFLFLSFILDHFPPQAYMSRRSDPFQTLTSVGKTCTSKITKSCGSIVTPRACTSYLITWSPLKCPSISISLPFDLEAAQVLHSPPYSPLGPKHQDVWKSGINSLNGKATLPWQSMPCARRAYTKSNSSIPFTPSYDYLADFESEDHHLAVPDCFWDIDLSEQCSVTCTKDIGLSHWWHTKIKPAEN